MTPQNLMEFIDGGVLTTFVNHPLRSQGGLFLVGPPESLKTSILERALKPYENALCLSDCNAQQLTFLKEDISRGRYDVIAFKEFSKLFERDARTANNVLGHLRAFVDEGFSHSPRQDPRMQATTARCIVMGAMTESFYSKNFTKWVEDGFARRFLWLLFDVQNINKATQALLNREMVKLDGIPRRYPGEKEIPFELDEKEKKYIVSILKEQRGQTLPVAFMAKLYCALKWKYHKEPHRVREILDDVTPALSVGGATLVL